VGPWGVAAQPGVVRETELSLKKGQAPLDRVTLAKGIRKLRGATTWGVPVGPSGNNRANR
jgi:hypothetical protein